MNSTAIPNPEHYFNEDGSLKPQIPLHDMPTDKGQLHILTASGIGDAAWVFSKYLHLHETRDVTFWFNEDETKRVKPYADMLGVKYGFTSIDNKDLLSYPGQLSEDDMKDGGIFYVHANRHLESGQKLVDWHPWLPIRNPAPESIGRWNKMEQHNYITVHMCMATYVEGNYLPRKWAQFLKRVEEEYGPVCVLGALWDTPFAKRVFQFYEPETHKLDAHLSVSLRQARSSRCHIGLDSGLTILAKYLGVPAMQAFPEWLWSPEGTRVHPNGTCMPGTYDMDFHPLSANTHVAELMDDVWSWLDKVLK